MLDRFRDCPSRRQRGGGRQHLEDLYRISERYLIPKLKVSLKAMQCCAVRMLPTYLENLVK
jgi:hypothetical protein